MDEATTRLKKIDPALRNVGWDEVPQSEILVEQSAYIAPGMVSAIPQNKHPKKADYNDIAKAYNDAEAKLASSVEAENLAWAMAARAESDLAAAKARAAALCA